MQRLMILCAAVFAAMTMWASTVNYTADETTIFPNPERGYYLEVDHVVTAADPWCIKNDTAYIRSQFVTPDKLSLLLVLYYLDNFKNEDLPQSVLDGFDEDMAVLRKMGLKCILRFAYTSDDTGEIGYDAPLARVEKHIGQYKAHWEANADVIYCFQAGFVGAWGEWYYTSNFGNKESRMNESRRLLVDTLLKAVPEDRFIQLRTPIFKTDYVGDTDPSSYDLSGTTPLTKEEAYSGSARSRLGHHNDAFLYGPDNMGTYRDTAIQKPYVAQEALYVPLGGETDITDEDDAKEWATPEKTIAEMSRMHWTFIQGYYSQTVTDMWRDNGTFDELNRKMGYRYELVSSTIDDEVEQGKKLSVNLKISNVGFAPLYNERKAYIVLVDSKKSIVERIQMATDPRTWLPNGVVTEIEEQLTIPKSVPQGTYKLYLHLPDAYESLAGDARYAIRFANEDVWDAGTGMNDLKAHVTVTEPAYVPGTPIALPATFNKANVTDYSEDMTWYNTDYFDFGPEDASNLDRWAEWTVDLKYPGKYIVSENMASVWVEDPEGDWLIGHSWQLQLLNGETVKSTYTTEASWSEGEIYYTAKWDLSSVAKGTYTLRVKNATSYAQPKLKSLTLEYDGEIPTGVDGQWTMDKEQRTGYDILGRPVGAGYEGIVVTKGGKVRIVR